MKLVTGIEAIQSGKPWKHRDCDDWMDQDVRLGCITSSLLLKKEFIIKEEPREFWIRVDSVGFPVCISTEDKSQLSGWIRVREVEK